ncbi:MAG: hypothetical protein R3D63_00080 [Paracoccaceae bacterium]
MIDLAPPPPPPPPPPEPVPEGWEGILTPGERILWQGRPEPGIDWRGLVGGRMLFGLVFAGFALFWMAMAFSMTRQAPGGLGLLFPLFGLPFLLVGVQMAGGHLWLDARRRRGTHYTLTDRAAFVATETGGQRRLERYPLVRGMTVTLDEGAPGNLWFSETLQSHRINRTTASGHRRIVRRSFVTRQRTGFERIAEPRRVWQLMGRAIAALPAPDDARPDAPPDAPRRAPSATDFQA